MSMDGKIYFYWHQKVNKNRKMNDHCNLHENVSISEEWQFTLRQQYSPLSLVCNIYATDNSLCANGSSIMYQPLPQTVTESIYYTSVTT
jgi:hypothetical protein